MTMPFDVFAQAEPQSDPQSAAAEWTQALQDPRVKASMLSMGLQLMQPVQPGQSVGGHIAQAVGAGGETIGNIEEMDRKESEQARKERDTDSMMRYREDRTETAAMEAESRDRLRKAQAGKYQSDIQKRETEIKLLELRLVLEPRNMALKEQLGAAKAALDQARANPEIYESQSDLRRAQAEDARSRAGTRGEESASRVERNRAQADYFRRRPATGGMSPERLDIIRDKEFNDAVKEAREHNSFNPKNKIPVPTREEFYGERGWELLPGARGGPARTPTSTQTPSPTGTPTPTPQGATIPTIELAPTKPEERKHLQPYRSPTTGAVGWWDAKSGRWLTEEDMRAIQGGP